MAVNMKIEPLDADNADLFGWTRIKINKKSPKNLPENEGEGLPFKVSAAGKAIEVT